MIGAGCSILAGGCVSFLNDMKLLASFFYEGCESIAFYQWGILFIQAQPDSTTSNSFKLIFSTKSTAMDSHGQPRTAPTRAFNASGATSKNRRCETLAEQASRSTSLPLEIHRPRESFMGSPWVTVGHRGSPWVTMVTHGSPGLPIEC